MHDEIIKSKIFFLRYWNRPRPTVMKHSVSGVLVPPMDKVKIVRHYSHIGTALILSHNDYGYNISFLRYVQKVTAFSHTRKTLVQQIKS